MSEGPSKPGAIADAKALGASDDAQARVRAWWRLVPRVLTRPREVFVALREDDETDVDARSEPILAIVIVAGMAAMLLTPAWGRLLDEESLDWIVLAVVTFIGGLLYGAFGYFLLGFVVWLGARGGGVDARAREARQVVAFAALPFALSVVITVPAIVLVFGTDWFRSGGADDGGGRVIVVSIGLACALWSLGLLAIGLRTTFELPWRGVVGALALAPVLVGAIAVLPTVL
ncbi:MAG: YIP1 family protein [Thermoleophilia bacterium]|nr:YIP1 family protein [Thermoleophilia bacterium]